VGNARARKIPAQLVEDEEYQLRHERVAGIDIAKAKADVCTRLPPVRDGGRRASRVEEVPAEAREILALAERLLAEPGRGRGHGIDVGYLGFSRSTIALSQVGLSRTRPLRKGQKRQRRGVVTR